MKKKLSPYLKAEPENIRLFYSESKTEILDPQVLQDLRIQADSVIWAILKQGGMVYCYSLSFVHMWRADDWEQLPSADS